MSAVPARRLIVNADDFGMSAGVNRGVADAHERGIVTSASLMVARPAAADAAAYAGAHPRLSLGLHVDLGEWMVRDGEWIARYVRVPLDRPAAVAAEVRRQLDAFRALTGRNPTHLDSHQHVHRDEPARAAVLAVARELRVPLRHTTPGLRYCGDFYGQTREGTPYPEGITVERLVAVVSGLAGGATELACHPGDGTDADGMYTVERAAERAALCDPRVGAALAEGAIELCSFSDFAGLAP